MPKSKKLGEFTILEALGEGGFGKVYKVKDQTGRICAAKQASSDYPGFIDEMKILEDMYHPNIIHVIETHPGHDPPFYVMEYIPAGSLEEMLQGPLDPKVVLLLADNVLEGLKYAKIKEIFHADLKPSNILMGDRPKIADFGIISKSESKDLEMSGDIRSVARSRKILGTLEYMSDERKRGEAPVEQDSIYSLGQIMHKALTGRVSGGARGIDYNKKIPGSVREIVKKAMDPKEKRYQTLEEIQQDISRLLDRTSRRVLPESLSNKYVPSKLLPTNAEIYKEGIAKMITHARRNLEYDLAAKIEKSLGADKSGCHVKSKKAEVRITGQSCKKMNKQYYAVELSEDKKRFMWYDGKKQPVLSDGTGFKIKRAIQICTENNYWDAVPEKGVDVFKPQENVRFKKPTWYYPKNRINILIDISVSARYQIEKKVRVKKNELKSAVIKQVWAGDENYTVDAHLYFAGTENFAMQMNEIKLDNFVLKSSKPEIKVSSRRETPYYVTVPAGLAGFGLSALFMPNLLTGAIVCPIIANLSGYLASRIYKRKRNEELIERKKVLAKEQNELDKIINNDLQKEISIKSSHFELSE